MLILNANEFPLDIPGEIKKEIIEELYSADWNRYPDTDCVSLRETLGSYTGVASDMIAVGNGSDELIYLVYKALLNLGDRVMQLVPTFTMYSFYGRISGVEMCSFKLDGDFKFNTEELKSTLKNEKPAMLILCNPNNPTGGVIELCDIKDILSSYSGYVLLDEAYFEFYGESGIELLGEYENLIILRTLSKAFSLAGLRIGYAVASTEIIERISSVKSPYNVNSLTQIAAIKLLKNHSKILQRVEGIRNERERVFEELNSLDDIRVYPSRANFLLVIPKDINQIREVLKEENIRVRYFEDSTLKDYLRITIGTKEENDRIIEAFRRCSYE